MAVKTGSIISSHPGKKKYFTVTKPNLPPTWHVTSEWVYIHCLYIYTDQNASLVETDVDEHYHIHSQSRAKRNKIYISYTSKSEH